MDKEINIKDIPEESFEGYYWYSDAHDPMLLKDIRSFKQELLDSQNGLPFIIEANLYDTKNQIGLSVRHIDGQYKIAQINLKDFQTDEFSIVEKHFKGIAEKYNFKMLEIWQAEKDPLLEGLLVKRPLLSVFAGFTN